jgi:hypothetical protein
MHDSTQYNMSIWALDPCGNVTEVECGNIWYYGFFVPPTLAYFDISIMGGCDVKAPKDSTIAGNSLTVTVTAMDADSSRRAVAYEGDATLASIMQGPTATPSWKEENGVVDLGGGMASLDGTYWVGGQQVLTVTDNTAETIAMVTVTDAGDSTLTGSSGSLTWVPAMFTSFVIVPDSSVQYVGEPFKVLVWPVDKYGNISLAMSGCLPSWYSFVWVTFSSNKLAVELPGPPQRQFASVDTFDVTANQPTNNLQLTVRETDARGNIMAGAPYV